MLGATEECPSLITDFPDERKTVALLSVEYLKAVIVIGHSCGIFHKYWIVNRQEHEFYSYSRL
jgi:hypothetical protein